MPNILFNPCQVIIDNDYITLVYYPDQKIIHHTFHRPTASQDFRAALNCGAEVLQQYGATKWLSDDRKNGPLSPEDVDWANTDWLPRVAKAGWKYWALVVPDLIEARISLQESVEQVDDNGVKITLFTTPEKAGDWLRHAKP